MEKFRKRYKVYALILIIIFYAFLFFTNDAGTVLIENSSIITAMGIDKENDEYIVSCQFASFKKSESDLDGILVTANGSSVHDALEQIHIKTGWLAKDKFCSIIILGNSVLEDNIFNAIEYFLLGDNVNEVCLLSGSEQSAQYVLSQNPYLDNLSGLAAQKTILKPDQNSNDAIIIDLRDYLLATHSKSAGRIIPLLEIVKSDFKQENALFSPKKTAIVIDNKIAAVLTPLQTRLYNIVNVKKARGQYKFSNIKDVGEINAEITKKRLKKTFSIIDGFPVCKLSLDMTFKQESRLPNAASLKNISHNLLSDTEILSDMKLQLQYDIESLFNTCSTVGYDLFGVADGLYQYKTKDYEKYIKDNPDYVKDIKLDLHLTVKNTMGGRV